MTSKSCYAYFRHITVGMILSRVSALDFSKFEHIRAYLHTADQILREASQGEWLSTFLLCYSGDDFTPKLWPMICFDLNKVEHIFMTTGYILIKLHSIDY